MEHLTSKEEILKRIRLALREKAAQPFPDLVEVDGVFPKSRQNLAGLFGEQFEAVQGTFKLCASKDELVKHILNEIKENNWGDIHCLDQQLLDLLEHPQLSLKNSLELKEASVGVTSCEALIARTGSVLLSSSLLSGRSVSIYPPVHIVIAFGDQIHYNIDDGLKLIRQKYGHDLPSMINLATGPSRTADIEKTLVLGAHGPSKVYVYLLDKLSRG